METTKTQIVTSHYQQYVESGFLMLDSLAEISNAVAIRNAPAAGISIDLIVQT